MDHIKGLIFDMDGVLADVAQSYRQAIVQTAVQYGVTLTHEQIEKEKISGNANNDWILTHRMLASQGVTNVSLDEVTSTFEALYQGTEFTNGLYKLESLIPARGVLQELALRFSHGMVIVTGRPRKDCFKFLKDFQ